MAGGNSKMEKIADLSKDAFIEDNIISINHTSNKGHEASGLVKICKTVDFPEGNCKLA